MDCSGRSMEADADILLYNKELHQALIGAR